MISEDRVILKTGDNDADNSAFIISQFIVYFYQINAVLESLIVFCFKLDW